MAYEVLQIHVKIGDQMSCCSNIDRLALSKQYNSQVHGAKQYMAVPFFLCFILMLQCYQEILIAYNGS